MSPTPAGTWQRLANGAAWITIDQVFNQAVSLLVFAILAHFLQPQEFGLVSIAFVLVFSVKNIVLDSIPMVIARKANGSDLEYSTAFWMTCAVGLGIFLVLQLLSTVIDRLFGTEGLGPVLRAMSAVMLVHGVARTQEVWMLRHFHYRTLAIRSGFGAVAGGFAGIAAAVMGLGVWALVAQQVVGTLAAAALLLTTCPWRPALAFSRAAARETAALLWSMIGGSLAYAFNQNADTLLIGFFFGPASVGVYNVAKRLRLALQLVAATPVTGVALPALAEIQTDPARFNQALLTAVTIIFAVCGPIFLGAGAVGGDAIALLFGPQWIAAGPIFSWLAIGGLCAIVIDTHSNVFLIRSKPGWILGIALLNIAATLAIFWVMRFQREASIALPFVLPYLLCVPVSVGLLLRITGLRATQWAAAAAAPLAAAAVMALMLHVARPYLQSFSVPARLLIMIGIGVLMYCAASCLLPHRQASALLSVILRRRAA